MCCITRAELESRLLRPHGLCADDLAAWRSRALDPLGDVYPTQIAGNPDAPGSWRSVGGSPAAKCAWEAVAQRAGRFTSLPFGSVARVRSFLLDTLSGQLASFHHNCDINHVFSQCTTFCKDRRLLNATGWMFVGTLEHFQKDLLRLVPLLGLQLAATRVRELLAAAATVRHQGKSNRSTVAKAAVRHAFAQDATVRRSLCYLIAHDYACINNLLPRNRQYQAPTRCNE